MAKLVRLKPFDPKRGFVVRRYIFEHKRYEVESGWYEVDDATGAKLKLLLQNEDDLSSKDLFDVCEPGEARALEERERVAAERAAQRASAARPHRTDAPARAAMTTRDLVRSSRAGDALPETDRKMIDPVEDDEEEAEAAAAAEREAAGAAPKDREAGRLASIGAVNDEDTRPATARSREKKPTPGAAAGRSTPAPAAAGGGARPRRK